MRVLNHISKKVIFESMTAKTIKELVSEADLTGADLHWADLQQKNGLNGK